MEQGSSTVQSSRGPGFGALVISLDFELHWGVRDRRRPDSSYLPNLLGARRAIPRMLALFGQHRIAATWATVGFLFARSRAERERFRPPVLPEYKDRALDPYSEPTGEDETDDPLHYGASLIDQIRATPLQEIATHTFSHYYCLEPGQTRAAFAADLRSATTIALRYGIPIRSIVFPRNQCDPSYAAALREAGVFCYRGCGRGWFQRSRRRAAENIAVRTARWLDNYVALAGRDLTAWAEVLEPDGLCNVRSSLFLRPVSGNAALEKLRFERIRHAIERAAVRKEIFHLWWHPHNFGTRMEENLLFLESLLKVADIYRDSHGLRSLSMAQTAEIARQQHLKATAA